MVLKLQVHSWSENSSLASLISPAPRFAFITAIMAFESCAGKRLSATCLIALSGSSGFSILFRIATNFAASAKPIEQDLTKVPTILRCSLISWNSVKIAPLSPPSSGRELNQKRRRKQSGRALISGSSSVNVRVGSSHNGERIFLNVLDKIYVKKSKIHVLRRISKTSKNNSAKRRYSFI